MLREHWLLIGYNYVGFTPYTGLSYVTFAGLGPVKRATCTDFAAKSRTTLHFLQQLFAACTTWLVARQVCNIFLTSFAAMLLNKLYVCVAHFTVNSGSEHPEWLPQAKSKDLFIWRWWTPGRWGNPLRWSNPPVHIIFHFILITFTR